MKKQKSFMLIGVILTIASIFPAFIHAQTTFERRYGGADYDWGVSVQQTSDGGYIIVGGSRSFGAGGNYVYLVKTDANGDNLWTHPYGGEGNDNGYSVQQTSDGGYVITGWTPSFGAGGTDVYLVKTDAGGDTLWTHTYGGTNHDSGYSVQQTSDGGYIIAGQTVSFGAGGVDVYLVKTEANGDSLWTRTYGGAERDFGYSVQQTFDGGYIIVGGTRSFGAGNGDVYLIKTDAEGDSLWTRTYGGTDNDYGYSVQQTSDDGYIIVGTTWSFGAGGPDVYLVKTDVGGDTLWTRTFGGSEDDNGLSVQQTSDGGYIIAGYTDSFGAGGLDVYLVKTDVNGDTLWTRTFGGTEKDTGTSVQQTLDGGYIIAGETMSFGAGLLDVYLIKTDASGMTPVEEENPEKIESFQLFQNYPNPFNLETVIQYHVLRKSRVTLKVFDLLGKEVRTLIDREEGPGYKTAQWDGKDDNNSIVPSGVYIYQIKAKDFVQSKKLILLK